MLMCVKFFVMSCMKIFNRKKNFINVLFSKLVLLYLIVNFNKSNF